MQPSTDVYSAPRRFDLATVIVVTAAFCLLLGTMQASGVPAAAMAYIAGGFAMVGVAQAVLWRGESPRYASMTAGAGYLALTPLVSLWLTGDFWPAGVLLALMVSLAVQGAIAGYLAGGIIGGVFLLTDYVRQALDRCGRDGRRGSPPPEVPRPDAPRGKPR
ncbi:MAG: hypothetical protein AAGB00_08785 [Planctomycetota bacterium]